MALAVSAGAEVMSSSMGRALGELGGSVLRPGVTMTGDPRSFGFSSSRVPAFTSSVAAGEGRFFFTSTS